MQEDYGWCVCAAHTWPIENAPLQLISSVSQRHSGELKTTVEGALPNADLPSFKPYTTQACVHAWCVFVYVNILRKKPYVRNQHQQQQQVLAFA